MESTDTSTASTFREMVAMIERPRVPGLLRVQSARRLGRALVLTAVLTATPIMAQERFSSEVIEQSPTFQPRQIDEKPAEDNEGDFKLTKPVSYELDSAVELKGWRIGSGWYFGRAKFRDIRNVGFVFDKGKTSYSIGDEGFVFILKF